MANNYKLGNIGFDLITDPKSTFQILDKLNKRLQQLSNTINRVNQLSEKIRITQTKVDKLYSTIQLNQQKGLLNEVKIAKESAKVNEINAKINDINSKTRLNEQKGVLNEKKIEQANLRLEKTKMQLDKIKEKSSKTKKIFSTLFDLGKAYFVLNYLKRFSSGIVNMSKKAIDFEETLNKFQVSMGKFYSRSIKFVNSLTYAFNISTNSVMNYMSTFNNMLKALGGIKDVEAYELSETLTRMAIDYASLFNTSIETAMEQFQATLSGQIRNIRSTSGYDVTENTIYSIYQSLGGTKTMRQLDQIEKRLLRIIALQKQMEQTGAVDDFANTINNTSNMIKQLQDTWEEITRWFGTLMLHVLEPFIEKVLASSIALREILKAINISLGYNYENLGGGKGLFGEIEESADDANESIKNLKNSLLGFDQLNVLGGTSTTGIGGDYKLLLDQIKEYSSSLENVKNNANKLADVYLTSLGYVKETVIQTDEEGNKIEVVNWKLDETKSSLDDILGFIKTIDEVLDSEWGGNTLGSFLFGGGKDYEGLLTLLERSSTNLDDFTNKIPKKLDEIKRKIAIFFNDIKMNVKNFFVNVFEDYKKKGIEFVNWWVELINNYIIGGFESLINIPIETINDLMSTKIWQKVFGQTEFLQKVEFGRIPQLTYNNAIDNEAQTTAIVDAISNGNMQIVKALKNSNNKPIYLNGKKVSEALYNDFNSVTDRKGIVGMEWGGS